MGNEDSKPDELWMGIDLGGTHTTAGVFFKNR